LIINLIFILQLHNFGYVSSVMVFNSLIQQSVYLCGRSVKAFLLRLTEVTSPFPATSQTSSGTSVVFLLLKKGENLYKITM